MTKIVVAVVAVFALAGLAVFTVSCPCERVPGLWLTGPEVDAPQDDWGFVNEVGLCQVEVQSWRAHSITLNCMSSEQNLYVSCSRCDGKYWSGVALESPAGKIRIEGKVYPVNLARITDADDLDRIWIARATKLKRDIDQMKEEQGEEVDEILTLLEEK